MTIRWLGLGLAGLLVAWTGCNTGTVVPSGDATDAANVETRLPGDGGDAAPDVHIQKPDVQLDVFVDGKWELPDLFQPDKLVPDEKPDCDAAP